MPVNFQLQLKADSPLPDDDVNEERKSSCTDSLPEMRSMGFKYPKGSADLCVIEDEQQTGHEPDKTSDDSASLSAGSHVEPAEQVEPERKPMFARLPMTNGRSFNYNTKKADK